MSELHVPESAQVAVTTRVDEFPFRTELSLAPLIRYWEHEIADGCSVLASVARTVLDQVAQAPELAGPVTDLTAVRAHDDLLRALMVAVFSPAAEDDGYAAALLPFSSLRKFVLQDKSSTEIARHFRVSQPLVEYRLKVTRLWSLYQAAHAND